LIEEDEMRKLLTVFAGLFLLAGMAGCRSSQSSEHLTPVQASRKSLLEAQMKAAAQTAQTYHAMDNPALFSKLMVESKAQREPFNSLAFRELRTRTNVDSQAVLSLVKENDKAGGLLPLLLLRRTDNKAYLGVPAEARAKILADALDKSKFFNTWGIPNLYLEDAGNAMVESGRAAVPALKRMLSDTRPAPVFGGQEHMVYARYKFRLCDYALYFLKRIGGDDKFREPVSPEERDALIKQMAK
jgi:hypothetical protein